MKFGIHWFRRDLRIQGNLNLIENFNRNEGCVLGLFCFDSSFLSRKDFSHNRFQFFLNSLVSLQNTLRSQGGDLLVLDAQPLEAFKLLLGKLKACGQDYPNLVSWGRDYEPFAAKRDARIYEFLCQSGIACFQSRDHLLIEPHEIVNGSGDAYRKFTPFARNWQRKLHEIKVESRVAHAFDKLSTTFKLTWRQLLSGSCPSDCLELFVTDNKKYVSVPIPKAGEDEAFKQLTQFKDRLESYDSKRDIPSLNGTSKLSIFLKNGSLTNSQVMNTLNLTSSKLDQGSQSFLNELIWREFYYHLLARFPKVETESFQEKFSKIKWENNPKWFDLWKCGKTGFPIVDAGMRQLATTGLMHNRVRMIVASFLCKTLHITWQWGEQYFMEKLLDGDLAANNGGWQWAASTGCDSQPYFRIFNPWTQSKKFDPDGIYIKTYITELKPIPPKLLHSPGKNHGTYPAPIVDHSIQRLKTLEMYQSAR